MVVFLVLRVALMLQIIEAGFIINSNTTHLPPECEWIVFEEETTLLCNSEKIPTTVPKSVINLMLRNLTYESLPAGIFDGYNKTEKLYLSMSKIKVFVNDSFAGLTGLKLLDILSYDVVREIETSMLKPLKNLQEFRFSIVIKGHSILDINSFSRVFFGLQNSTIMTICLSRMSYYHRSQLLHRDSLKYLQDTKLRYLVLKSNRIYSAEKNWAVL